MQAQVGAGMAEMMKDTPMYKSYVAVAPNPEDFPKLLDRMGAFMRKPYNWAEDVKTLKMPVMLVFGDSDMFRPEHIVEFYQLLGGGLKDAGWMREHMSKNRLAILPDLTHYEIFASPRSHTALPFLDGKSGAKSSDGGGRRKEEVTAGVDGPRCVAGRGASLGSRAAVCLRRFRADDFRTGAEIPPPAGGLMSRF